MLEHEFCVKRHESAVLGAVCQEEIGFTSSTSSGHWELWGNTGVNKACVMRRVRVSSLIEVAGRRLLVRRLQPRIKLVWSVGSSLYSRCLAHAVRRFTWPVLQPEKNIECRRVPGAPRLSEVEVGMGGRGNPILC